MGGSARRGQLVTPNVVKIRTSQKKEKINDDERVLREIGRTLKQKTVGSGETGGEKEKEVCHEEGRGIVARALHDKHNRYGGTTSAQVRPQKGGKRETSGNGAHILTSSGIKRSGGVEHGEGSKVVRHSIFLLPSRGLRETIFEVTNRGGETHQDS